MILFYVLCFVLLLFIQFGMFHKSGNKIDVFLEDTVNYNNASPSTEVIVDYDLFWEEILLSVGIGGTTFDKDCWLAYLVSSKGSFMQTGYFSAGKSDLTIFVNSTDTISVSYHVERLIILPIIASDGGEMTFMRKLHKRQYQGVPIGFHHNVEENLAADTLTQGIATIRAHLIGDITCKNKSHWRRK